MELPDADGRSRFVEPPNIERVLIQPSMVTAIVDIKEDPQSYAFEDSWRCVVIHMTGGATQAVRGTADEVRAKLEGAQ